MSVNRRLNRLTGIVSILSLSVSTENQYATAVLPEGILVKKSDDVLYRTDGIRPIRNLIPVADQVLNSQEKHALSSAFSNGVYRSQAGGVVIHNSSGKIDDASLGIIESGKLKEQYLSDFVSNGIIKYAKLPDDVKKGVIIVATYNTLNTLSVDDKKKLVIVLDASGDPSGLVTGNGLYYYYNNKWTNLLLPSGLDVTYESVQGVSGIMYDHPLDIGTTSNTIHQMLDALVVGEEVIDNPGGGDEPGPDNPDEPDVPTPPVTIHDETPDYIGTGWQNFIAGINSMLNEPPSDVYVSAGGSDYFTIESDDLTLAQTTFTITNTTTNDTIVLPVTDTVQNAVGIGVVEYDEDNEAIHELLHPSEGQQAVKNQILHLVVSDGVNTFSKDVTRNDYFNDMVSHVIDTGNGWSRV